MYIKISLFTTLLSIICFVSYAQSLKIDSTFGYNGFVKYKAEGAEFGVSYKVEALDDGSYLTLNYSGFEDEESDYYSLTKYFNSGDIDSSFADNGTFQMLIASSEYPGDFLVLSNGKIAMLSFTDIKQTVILIIDKNGALEKTIAHDITPGDSFTVPLKILVKEDMLYVGGITENEDNGEANTFVLKMNSEGELDDMFGENGIFVLEKVNHTMEFFDMAFQNDKLIIYGLEGATDGNSDRGFLTRIDTNANTDTGFGNDGFVFLQDHYFDFGAFLHIDDEQNMYCTIPDEIMILKLNEDGDPDLTYGNNGIAFIDTDLEVFTIFSLLQDDGKLMCFGSVYQEDWDDEAKPVIIRFDANGNPDTAFADNGIYIETVDRSGTYYNGTIDNEGKLLVVGGAGTDLPNYFLLARYTNLLSGTKNLLPQSFKLMVYPNPVTAGRCTVSFHLKKPGWTGMSLHTLNGSKIADMYDGMAHSGNNELSLHLPQGLDQGNYALIIHSENERQIKLIQVLDY